MNVRGVILTFLYYALLPAAARALSFDTYHDYDTIMSFLDKINSNESISAKQITIGYSEAGRPLRAIKFSTHKSRDQNEKIPTLLVNATHHGDEIVSTEASLDLIQSISMGNLATEWANILQTVDIVVIPLVNPDGFINGTRNNLRARDINRDYLFAHERLELPSTEAKAMMDYSDSLKLVAALALHAGDEAVFWPWGRTTTPIPEHERFLALGRQLARWFNFSTFKQSAYDYKTIGEYIDYVYSKQKTVAFTVEISELMQPDKRYLSMYTNRVVMGFKQFASLISGTFNGNYKLP